MFSVVHNHPSQPDEGARGPEALQGDLMFDKTVLGEGAAAGTATSAQRPSTKRSRPPTRSPRQQLVAGDIVALAVTWGALVGFRWDEESNPKLAACAVGAVAVTLFAMHRSGLYRARVCALRSHEAVRVFASAVFGTAGFLALQYVGMRVDVADALAAGGASVATVLVMRWRFGRWIRAHRSESRYLRTVLLVGANEDAEGLWTILSEEPGLGYRVGGVVGEARHDAPWAGLPKAAGPTQIPELARATGAGGVIVVASALGPRERTRAVNTSLASGLHVQLWPGFYGTSARRTRLVPTSGVPLLYVEPRHVAPWQLAAKRVTDVFLAAFVALVTSPIMAAVVVAIRLSGDGPIIYRSKRVGLDGEIFEVLKFRTMVPDAAERLSEVAGMNERKGPLFKATGDPRVTKVGRVLRVTSIDELPQLWNVVRGTMSMVGPRPALPDEVANFDQELQRRHEMRPGITGLWQVEARDNPSFNAYRRLDLSYVDDWSLSLDVAILATTAHELIVRALKELASLAGIRRERQLSAPHQVALADDAVINLNGLSGR
jgi:exopolysaccharide biosynthesis polyprenyl glycosylphosphotransferase